MPRGSRRGDKTSRRRRFDDSPPTSDESSFGSIQCDRTERVVTRSESQRETAATWDRLARGFRRGFRKVNCRGVSIVDGVRRVEQSQRDRSDKLEMPSEMGQNVVGGVVDKGKGKLELGGSSEEKLADTSESTDPVVVVVDGRTLETLEFVSTIETCLIELEKVMEILTEFSALLRAAASAGDECSTVVEKIKLLQEKERILSNMLIQATRSLQGFTTIIIKSVRVYHHLMSRIPKQTHLLTPKDSPLLRVLNSLAAVDGFTLFSFTYL